MLIRAARIPSLVAFVPLVVVLAACSSGGTSKQPTSSVVSRSIPAPMTPSAQPVTLSSEVPTPSTAATTTTPAASALSVQLNTTGWVGGFTVHVKSVALDPTTNSVDLDVVVTNLSQADTGFISVSSELLLDPGDGSGLLGARRVLPTNVIAGSSANGAIGFGTPSGFSLAKAVLVLGKPANHQWLVPLQPGRTATGERPITLKTPGLLKTTSNIYYRPSSAQLLPWSCGGVAPHTGYVPTEKTTSVVALNGTAGAGPLPVSYGAITSMSITAPDGTTASVITPPLRTWSSNQSTQNELLCVPVPAHETGTYRLTITDSENRSATTAIELP